jgi:hypothetical protein
MEYKNEYDQEEAVGQEEQAEVEVETEEQSEEDVVTISKDKFKSMQRKAMAYDATKKQTKPLQTRDIDEGLVNSVKKLETIEAKRQFGYENSLSPEETDFIFKFSNGKPDKTVLENPFVKSGLEGFRASKRVEDNTPGSTSRSPIFQGKEFKEMTDDERRKSFEDAAKKKGII